MDKKTIKDLKVGESCIISNDRQANPKVGAKLLSDGRVSLFLDYYFGYTMVYSESQDKMVPKKQKRREMLNIYILQKPRTPKERQEYKDGIALADKIRREKANAVEDEDKKEALKKKKVSINFLAFFQEYLDAYTKKDVRMIQIALQRFKDFLRDTPEYNIYEQKIKPEQITSEMVEAFTEYLQSRSVGEGARSIYQRFKKVYKACAIKCNINYQRPFVNEEGKSITITIDEDAIVKDFLSPEEEKQLMATHYTGENPQIRNAFVFCLYTGMRYCDVRDLTFGNFDFANRLLSYEQNKTKGHSKHSRVTLPLSDSLLALLGEEPESQDKDALVFTLPSHTMCLKALRRWTKRAGIDKHITWHCARHSFGTNMAATAAQKGLSVRVVQEMMGHSSLKYTERYTRVIDEQKKQAMAELSKLMQE
ncbi:MAG: site-specific integrase [Prevotella sp.]|nr:site-specific integrase [Prevotella sp.]